MIKAQRPTPTSSFLNDFVITRRASIGFWNSACYARRFLAKGKLSRNKLLIHSVLLFFSMPCWLSLMQHKSIDSKVSREPLASCGCGFFSRNFRMYLTLETSHVRAIKAWWQSNTPQKILLSVTEAAQGDGLTHTMLDAWLKSTHTVRPSQWPFAASVNIWLVNRWWNSSTISVPIQYLILIAKRPFSVKWSANDRWQKVEAKRQSR